ncbi:MAG: hypothetical protein HQL62_07100, partial [Magnetococcales bacterium]|nr:hypothetical protein [Magnetococcales bacterium]
MIFTKTMMAKRVMVFAFLVALPGQLRAGGKGGLPWQAALDHLYAGEYAQALVVLTPLEEKHVGNPAFDLVLGSVQYHLKDYGAAMFPLERLLMYEPGNETARLLLAMSLYRSGETTRALAEAANLHLDRLSPVLTREWQEMIAPAPAAAAAPAPSKTKVSGSIQASIGRDNNITSGPNDGVYIIPAISSTYPISLGKAESHPDWVNSLSGVLAISHTLDPSRTLIGGLSLYQTKDWQRKDKEEGYGNAYAGVALTFGDVTVTPVGYVQNYFLEDTLFQRYWGAQVNVAKPLNEKQSLASYVQFLDTTFPDYHPADTNRLALGLTHT